MFVVYVYVLLDDDCDFFFMFDNYVGGCFVIEYLFVCGRCWIGYILGDFMYVVV